MTTQGAGNLPGSERVSAGSIRFSVPQIVARIRPYALYAAFLLLIVLFTWLSPVFFSEGNFANIGRQTALVSIMAVGMTTVIVTAEIDLSVGSTLALAGMSAALAMQIVNSWVVGAVAGLATGALVGLINGILTTRLLIPSFIVTLGTLGICRGVALVVTNTAPVLISNRPFADIFGQGYLFGVPAPICLTILTLLFGVYLLHFSTFGRKLYASGGNPTAARYSGINVARVKTVAFVLTGTLAALAALVLSALGEASRPDSGSGLELDVIAAVILGGTSLFGGRGTIIGTLVGSLIIGILNNGLVLVGVDASWQLALKGAIIIFAVAFSERK
jgi:ribose/xylose/arabinose/galactoside ABC-type transport system permease subunit